MNFKAFGTCFFTFFVLTTSISSAPQKNRTDTIKTYERQLENQLQGISKTDRDKIIRDFNQELLGYTHEELANSATINTIKASIIGTYIKTKAEQEARKYKPNKEDIEQFSWTYYGMIITALENNEPLSPIFEYLPKIAENKFKPKTSSPIPAQPKPSAPPAEVFYPHNQHDPRLLAVYYASEADKRRITEGNNQLNSITPQLLNKGISNRNTSRFGVFFLQSVLQNPAFSAVTPEAHTQNAFIELFNHELNFLKNKLSQEIPPHIIKKAVEATRTSLIPTIKQLTPNSAERFQHIISTLEDTIIANAGVSCSICTETYKENDYFGVVDKLVLQSTGKPCHSICKTCAKNGHLSSCPECRKPIDQHDLRQKMSQPDSPANWRP